MKKSLMPFAALLSCLLMFAWVFSSGAAAQANTNIKGSWLWKSPPDKSGSRTVVGFGFAQTGNRVSGSYSVSSTGGPDDGAGAGSIPFIGTINGNTINIEYDPEDVHTDFETKFRYHRPKGKAPATATLTLQNGKLELRQTSGDLADKSMNVPRQFTMRRDK